MKNNHFSAKDQRIDAFKQIHADLCDVVKHKKCRTCACFYKDVLNIIYEKIRAFRATETDSSLEVIEDDFKRWISDAAFLKTHG